MHEKLLQDPLIVRCVGKLEGYTIYEAKNGFVPNDRGVTLCTPKLDREWWDKAAHELNTSPDRTHTPKNIFLDNYQVEMLMGWAKSLILPLDEDGLITCTDCKGSGWYVGAFERYACPTCAGKGKISP